MIENRIPSAAEIVRLPDSPVDYPDVENIRLAGNAGGSTSAAAAIRPDLTPAHFGKELRIMDSASVRHAGARNAIATRQERFVSNFMGGKLEL